MATPMEYDTLREIYSSAMASFTRLKIDYKVNVERFKEQRDNFVKVWVTEVKDKVLKDIDYQAVAKQMNDISKTWMELDDKLFEEQPKKETK